MTTPFTPTEMAAQESAALAHGDLLASRASTAASAALEHEAGRDYALTPLHPALIPG